MIPIYGRGGNEDPRSKSKGAELEAVPQRPAGQRPAPVVRNPLLQPNVNVAAQQGGLGIIPTLFGLQNGNGEALGGGGGEGRESGLRPARDGHSSRGPARRVCVLRHAVPARTR